MVARAERRTLRLETPFRISRDTEEVVEVVQVTVAHDGEEGHGEAAPQPYDGETAESALAYVEAASELLGDDPFALEAIGSRLPQSETAARAALDAALHDLCGKLTGLPVWRLLGLDRQGPATAWSIWLGDPDDMARRAEAARGFRVLKLKLGGHDGLDAERVRAVRAARDDATLLVDVNEGWTLDEALELLPPLAELGVALVEQPLPAGADDAPALKAVSPLPIVLDEACHVLADVAACARSGHGVNVKLAKCGGIREAVRMVHAARALGLATMLGCMIESSLGIAAACQIASLFDYVDLDGNLLLAEDPWSGVELRAGVQIPADAPGLGVREAVPSPR